tara:strand:- start:751 stop:1326 length:576 start_codon:yes stop_codon:yes gene_type:complete
MLLKRLISTIIVSATIAITTSFPVWATLIDGEYELSLNFDQPSQNENHTGVGSFLVTGGTIENVLVNFFRGSLSPYDYTGTNFIESAGNLFSAELSTPLPSGFSGNPFLTLNNDGTFICGGTNFSTFIENTCLLSHIGTSVIALSDISNSTGTYSFTRVASSVSVSAPGSFALLFLGLGALSIAGRRKVTT